MFEHCNRTTNAPSSYLSARVMLTHSFVVSICRDRVDVHACVVRFRRDCTHMQLPNVCRILGTVCDFPDLPVFLQNLNLGAM